MVEAKLPLVSIGMPVFNDREYIESSLESILYQSYSDFELIISDDGSTDGTGDICLRYAEKDSRIRYLRQEKNLGISRNMKFLLSKAQGEFFMWAGDDDVLHEDFIRCLLNKLLEEKESVMAYCTAAFINDEGNQIELVNTNYSGKDAYKRLEKLIEVFEDSCGYGLFRKEKITSVEFPVWWWVNKRRAYNNIYPALCFFLSRGSYCFLESDEPLFFKRIKVKYNNHYTPYTNSFLKSTFAFTLWKFNLVYCSQKAIMKGSRSLFLCLRILPKMTLKWFVIPTIRTITTKYRAFRRGEIKFY